MVFRHQSRYAPCQWEASLQCNDVSHWLGAYLDWSLHGFCRTITTYLLFFTYFWQFSGTCLSNSLFFVTNSDPTNKSEQLVVLLRPELSGLSSLTVKHWCVWGRLFSCSLTFESLTYQWCRVHISKGEWIWHCWSWTHRCRMTRVYTHTHTHIYIYIFVISPS